MSDTRNIALVTLGIGILVLMAIFAGAERQLSSQQANRTAVAEAIAVEALTRTATPRPTSAPTALPTDTPTATPTSVYAAELDDVERFFVVIEDEFEGSTMYAPRSLQRIVGGEQGAALAIIVWQYADGEQVVNWGASYRGDDWLFINQLRLKVGDTIYDVADIDLLETKRGVYLGGVTESVTALYTDRTHRPIIDAIYADPDNVTIRLAGDDGRADAALSRDEALSIVAAIHLAAQLSE